MVAVVVEKVVVVVVVVVAVASPVVRSYRYGIGTEKGRFIGCISAIWGMQELECV